MHGVQAGHGTATDRLRLALVYLLTCETLPSDSELAPVETALSALFPWTSELSPTAVSCLAC